MRDAVLDGRFRMDALARRGGMGEVWRAHDLARDRSAAVKLVSLSDPSALSRFEREARIAAAHEHPALVGFLGEGVTDAGTRYLALEWIEGCTLAERLREGAMPVAEILSLARRIAEGLSSLHRARTVHRDVKPDNIMLRAGRASDAVLVDFGIARVDTDLEPTTEPGMVVGTPRYMSPEQARGEAAIGPSADVFALGAVLYRCLAGRPAFDGDSPVAVLARVLFDEPEPLRRLRPDLPAALADTVHAMLAKDPALRPADADEVLVELEADEGARGPGHARRAAVTSEERRTLSVVLVGADGSARERAPRITAVARHHGVVMEPLVDGSLLAVLASGAAVDRANEAARLALALVARVPGARVALATGRAASQSSVSVGEVVASAAELLVSADPEHSTADPGGALRVDALTRRLLDASFETSGPDDGPGWVRTARDPLAARRTVLGRATPFVGRLAELALLTQALDEACGGEARVALVTGEPGVGKSRLRAEMVLLARARPSLRVWLARGRAGREGSPLAVAASLVTEILGAPEAASPEVRRAAIAAHVARASPGDAAARDTELLAELVGAPVAEPSSPEGRAAQSDPRLRQGLLRTAFANLLSAELRSGVVVLVLEDVHVVDRASLELLTSAVHELEAAPLLLLAFGRNEARQRFAELPRTRLHAQLELGPLPVGAARQLASTLVGEAVADAIARSAEGNPFLLEELARAHVEGRTAADSVDAIIERRYEALEPDPRRVARAASVGGTRFTRSAIGMLLGHRDLSRIDAALAILEEREIITRSLRARADGDVELAFRHDLLQRAAYGMLPPEERARAHRALADWLEEAPAPDPSEVALHRDRGGQPAVAALWYVRAARSALGAADPRTALENARAALATGDQATRGRAALAAATAHGWRGENRAAADAAALAMSLLSNDSAEWGEALGQAGLAFHRLGEIAQLRELGRRACEDLLAGRGWLARPAARVAYYLAIQGELADATALVRAIESRSDTFDPIVEGRLFETHAAIEDLTPYHHYVLAEAARAAYERGGDIRLACSAAVNAGVALLGFGHAEEAARVLAAAERRARAIGVVASVAAARQNLARALAALGSHAEAVDVAGETARAFADMDDDRMEGVSRAYRAFSLLALGRTEEAEQEARIAASRTESARLLHPMALATLARVLLATAHADVARLEAAYETADRAARELDELGKLEEGEMLVLVVLAEAARATGRHDRAGQVLDRAHTLVEATAARITDPAARALFLERVPEHVELARLLAAAGDRGASARTS